MSEAGEHGRAREHGSASSLHRRERESGAWSRRSLLTRLSAYARASCTGGAEFDAAVRSSATGSRRSLPIPLGRVDLLKLLLLVDPLFLTSLHLGLAGPDGSCVLCSTIPMAWRSSSCAVKRLCRVRTLLRRRQGRERQINSGEIWSGVATCCARSAFSCSLRSARHPWSSASAFARAPFLSLSPSPPMSVRDGTAPHRLRDALLLAVVDADA